MVWQEVPGVADKGIGEESGDERGAQENQRVLAGAKAG